MARAKQDRLGDTNHDHVLSVLIHGDAAFAGQGVVAETLNLSELPGYDVGGTVHIVVNNQVGFTTTPGFARSTVYATDIAKAVQAPIFHVNGDDPEAAVRTMRLALEFRNVFKKDVVVDQVCYRRYGHNESDEPAFTQPRMYEVIGKRRSIRKLYTELLVNRGDLTLEEAEHALEAFRARLEEAFDQTKSSERPPARLAPETPEPAPAHIDTGVPREKLDADRRRAHHLPAPASNRTRSWRASSPRGGPRSTPTRSTGRSPKHSRSVRCCSKARPFASQGRTHGGARSASGTRRSSTTAPRRSTRPSNICARMRRRS